MPIYRNSFGKEGANMKTAILLIFITSISCSQGLNIRIDNKDIYDDELTIEYRGEEELHIDKNYDLFIFGEKVETTKSDKRLLKEYVLLHRDIVRSGIQIGKAGAKLGIKAGAMAIGATVEALGALMTGDEDEADEIFEDMEKDIEYDAEFIEEMGEEIEEMADDLDDVRRKLRRKFPRLKKVDDF